MSERLHNAISLLVRGVRLRLLNAEEISRACSLLGNPETFLARLETQLEDDRWAALWSATSESLPEADKTHAGLSHLLDQLQRGSTPFENTQLFGALAAQDLEQARLAAQDWRLSEHLLYHAPEYREQVIALIDQARDQRAAGSGASLKQLLVQQRILTAADLVYLLQEARAGREPSEHDPPPSLGATLDAPPLHSNFDLYGRYRALDEIARGGMGIVYRARDEQTDQIVALKVLKSGDQAKQDEIERFDREVESMRKLVHPNIVKIHGSGQDRGRCYYAMNYIEGTSLDELHLRETFSHRQAAEILLDVARALEAAHAQDVIHRDLKPANILIDTHGVPMLTDFGLAKLISGSVMTLTQSGALLGTPFYMAPEQINENGVVDVRTDVYALGVVLYQCLTRKLPHVGGQAVLFYKILEETPVPPRKHDERIPLSLETICLKAMSKAPAHRYQNITEMAADLERFLTGQSIQARRSSLILTITRHARRQRKLLIGSLATALCISPLIGWLALRQLRAGEQASSARQKQALLHRASLESRIREILTRSATQQAEPALALHTLVQSFALYNELGRPTPAEVRALEAYLQARLSFERKDYQQTRRTMDHAIKIVPKDSRLVSKLYRLRAKALLKLGRSAEAQADVSRAQQLARRQADELLRTAQTKLAAGKHNLALAAAAQAIGLLGSRTGQLAFLLRGQIYLARGLARRAIPDLQAAARAGPPSAAVTLALAQAFVQLGQLESARKQLAAFPNSAACQAALGEVAHRLGRQLESLEAFMRAGDAPRVLLGRARALILTDRAIDALPLLARLERAEKSAEQAYWRGRALRRLDRRKSARRSLLIALRDPRWRNRANLQLAQLDLARGKARAAMARLQVGQAGAGYLRLKGRVALALGDPAAAVDMLTRSIERYPYDHLAYRLRGDAHRQRREYIPALQDLVQSYSINAEDFSIFESLIRCMIESGRVERMLNLNATMQTFKSAPKPEALRSLFRLELRRLLAAKSALEQTQPRRRGPASKQEIALAIRRLGSADSLEQELARTLLLRGGPTVRPRLLEAARESGPRADAIRNLLAEIDRQKHAARRGEVEDLLVRYNAGRYGPAGSRLHTQASGSGRTLHKIFRDPSAELVLRIWAARALLRPLSLKAIERMQSYTRGRNPQTSLIAAWVLRESRIAATFRPTPILESGKGMLTALALLSLGPAQYARAVPFLTHARPRLRYAAAVTLLRARDRRALKVLAALQTHKEPLIRQLGVVGLGTLDRQVDKIEDWPLMPFYRRALQDSDSRVRDQASRVIRYLKDQRAAELLFEAVRKEREPYTVSQLVYAQEACFTQDALRHIGQLLDDQKQPTIVRSVAFWVLMRRLRQRDFSVIPYLQRLLESQQEPLMTCGIMLAMARYLPLFALPALKRNLQAKHPYIRAMAMAGLTYMVRLSESDKKTLLRLTAHDPDEMVRRIGSYCVAVCVIMRRIELPGYWQKIASRPASERLAIAESLARLPRMGRLPLPEGVQPSRFYADALRRALELRPDHAPYYWELARYALQNNKPAEAERAIKAARKLGLDRPEGFEVLARYHAAGRRWRQAAAAEQALVASWLRDPHRAWAGVDNEADPTKAMLRAGSYLMRANQFKAGTACYRHATYLQVHQNLELEPFLTLCRLQAGRKKAKAVAGLFQEMLQLGVKPMTLQRLLKTKPYAAIREAPAIRKLFK